jgi:deoxyadenosine/deoxycytidine kinase
MSERDFETYHDLYEGIRAFLPPPDLLIYLKASVGTLAERITQRGRPYELQISIDYLNQLNELYNRWADEWSICPILVIEADALDFVHRPEDLGCILAEVRANLNLAEV